MKKPEIEDPNNLPDLLWEAINERLWHATSTEGLKGILETGKIKIGNRYKNSLCRHLGCVSLFDFGPSAKNYDRQFLNWWGWFGHQQKSKVVVWLEIDRDATADKVYDAGKMHEIWKKNLNKQFIPGVEAGHKGPIPLCVLKGALLIYHRHDLTRFERFEEVNETLIRQIEDFEKSLPPEPEPFKTRLEASLNRYHKNEEEKKT
ncbi:MAG: hypothetical protein F4X91_08995 [Nitrospinae bacterium]|nr:hypothetical protein [Nitrospinota bacterium]